MTQTQTQTAEAGDFDVHAFAERYEFRDPDHTPTEAERAMLEDFGEGLLAALAAAAQVNPGREEIARIIEPRAWALFDRIIELRTGRGESLDLAKAAAQREYGKDLERSLIKADAILAARPGAEGDAPLERVRHVKRGTEYEVLGQAMGQQLDEYGEPHPHSLVIYRKVGSKRLSWILPAEFPNHFVPAARPAPSPAKGGV